MSEQTPIAEPLLAPRFLFRFSTPLLHHKKLWSATGVQLETKYRLLDLAQLDGERPLADVRLAWSEEGIGVNVRIEGKRQPPWCRDSRLEDSDGLQLWIDTRDTQTIHRAGRFCHRFVFMPAGGGRKSDQPVVDQLLINRARENATPVRPGRLQIRSEKRIDGYLLEGFIPADCLTGFEPSDHPRLGFTYALVDREQGIQTFSTGSNFPYQEDPSTWATLELSK